MFGVLCLKAQDANNQAMVTIIGDDPVQITNTVDFINTNPYQQPDSPVAQKIESNQNIEPTLENGFHMRFEISANPPVELTGTSSISPSGGSSYKTKRKERKLSVISYNLKKRIKRRFPARKKKYRPSACGRF